PWKRTEKYVAEMLHGQRNQRGANFGKSMPDVEHPLFSVEVKYRKLLPRLLRLGLAQAQAYDKTKPPLLIVKERSMHGALVVLKLADFADLLGPLTEWPQTLQEETDGEYTE
ncbi:MAG TPA: hypothetical protein VKJ47_13515, partial [Candidatus Binatia bacterium]|nr:hypothetical protein [Candidatus Binatia bacterium]